MSWQPYFCAYCFSFSDLTKLKATDVTIYFISQASKGYPGRRACMVDQYLISLNNVTVLNWPTLFLRYSQIRNSFGVNRLLTVKGAKNLTDRCKNVFAVGIFNSTAPRQNSAVKTYRKGTN